MWIRHEHSISIACISCTSYLFLQKHKKTIFISSHTIATQPLIQTRSQKKRAMEQLEQNQAALREEMTQLKGTVEDLQGGMAQVLSFMKDLKDKQDKAKEVHDHYEEIPNDKNPLLGYVKGYDPHKAKAHSSKRVITTHEEGEASQEGFIPTIQKEGTSRTVRIPVNNTLRDEDYLDLQYGDTNDTDQVPQPKLTSADSGENSKESGQIKALEERMKAMEGYDVFDVDTYEMSLVPDLTIPHKFKIPDFEKYKGLSCPRNHLRMYVRKMAAYAHDQKLMMHFFQDSLSGASVDWYMQLEKSHIRGWTDLANTFLKQYKYNLDMAPDRMQLQNLSQKKEESFKEYAQRWREMASRVQPPLLEKELVKMFMATLQGPYYDKMAGSVSSGFSDLVVIGERIEDGIKSGKIQGASSNSYQAKRPTPNFAKKKEGETNAVGHQENRPPISYPPPQNRFPGGQRRFDPLPTSKKEILKYLINESLVEVRPLPPLPPGKITPNYKPNERCEFHANSPGHTLEKCWAFRHIVQDLIESGAIAFDKPNVKTNPMPHHEGAVNAIEVVNEQELVQQRNSPIDALKRYLLIKGFILEHNEAFEDTLQRLMDQGLIQLEEHPEEEYVAMLERNEPLMIPAQGARKPLIIPCSRPPVMIPAQERTKIIPIRGPYPLDQMKAVPWEYETDTNTAVSSIIGPGGMTRSGRIFKTAQVQPTSSGNLTQSGEQVVTRPIDEAEPKDKETSNKDAEEFLALIKKSDYRVVDQLQQTPSKISLLSLLIHSEKHRDALMKILNAAHVTKDITVNQFDGMVANLTAGACLGFSDNELSPQGKAHNKALHISLQCGKAHLARVLIDTGSSLNVMPKATLDKIALEGLVVRPSRLVVKAFDGSQSPVFGEVDLPVIIGPHTFCINFQVMEIEPAYTCLLGRPWIHAAGAVTSTLHQKLKFVNGNSIVTVNGEEDIFVNNLDSYRYIEAGEGALETAFQALEIATAVTLPVEKIRRAVTSWRDLQDMNVEGWGKVPEIMEKRDCLGLGCQPTKKAAKEEQRFPPIKQTFVTGGYEHVFVISSMEGTSNFIKMIRPGEQLQNWTSLEIPEIVYVSK